MKGFEGSPHEAERDVLMFGLHHKVEQLMKLYVQWTEERREFYHSSFEVSIKNIM